LFEKWGKYQDKSTKERKKIDFVFWKAQRKPLAEITPDLELPTSIAMKPEHAGSLFEVTGLIKPKLAKMSWQAFL